MKKFNPSLWAKKHLKFLPNTQWGYAPCLCGKKCDIACYRHLKGELK